MAPRGKRMRKTKTIKASDAKQQFDQIVNQVFRDKTRVLIEEEGTSLAAIVTARDLETLKKLEQGAEEALTRMRAAFSDLSEEQMVEDVARVIEEVRAERRRTTQAQANQ